MYPVRQCTARLLYGVCVDVSRKGLLGAYMKSVPSFQHHVPWPTVRSREGHRGFQLSGCAGNRERTQATHWLSCLCINQQHSCHIGRKQPVCVEPLHCPAAPRKRMVNSDARAHMPERRAYSVLISKCMRKILCCGPGRRHKAEHEAYENGCTKVHRTIALPCAYQDFSLNSIK